MGTGGSKPWVKEANEIAEKFNQATNIMAFELGGETPPQLQQIGPGQFLFKCFDKEWIITINLKK